MLLVEKRFKDFINDEIADAATTTETITMRVGRQQGAGSTRRSQRRSRPAGRRGTRDERRADVRRQLPGPRRSRLGTALHGGLDRHGVVVDSVNVSVLLYLPVRSGSAGTDRLPQRDRQRVVADRAGVLVQHEPAGVTGDRREDAARRDPRLQRVAQRERAVDQPPGAVELGSWTVATPTRPSRRRSRSASSHSPRATPGVNAPRLADGLPSDSESVPGTSPLTVPGTSVKAAILNVTCFAVSTLPTASVDR